MKKSRKNRQIRLSSDTPVENKQDSQIPIQFMGRGSSGIRNFSGYISEEYLHELHGHVAADTYDKMRRSDSKIKKVLKAVKDPIKAANWEIHAADDDANSILHKEFIEHALFEGMSKEAKFPQFVSEALTVLEFGHSVFEKIHQVVLNHPTYGNYIGLRKLSWRSPRTLHKFNIDPQTEDLKSVTQYAYGDAQRLVDIEAKFLVIVTLDREGANWEGISALRNCYGAFIRKQMFLKLLAIGIEKYAIPTAVGNVPKSSGPDYDAFIAALEKYTSHETNYITLPTGWTIDLKDTNFDASKVRAAIDGENMEIVDAFIANFLELAMGSGGGSKALSEDMSSFFLSGITQIANLISGALNDNAIKDLIDLNFGPQVQYPKLAVSGITDKAGIDLANALKALVDAKVIIPDDHLEENLRKRYDFPKPSLKGQRQVQDQSGSPSPGPGGSPFQRAGLSERGLSNLQVQLAEKNAKQTISANADQLKEVFKTGLSTIGKRLISDLMKAASKLSDANKVSAVRKVDAVGTQSYQKNLRAALMDIAYKGVESARRDVPKAKNVTFKEPSDSDYDLYIPQSVQKAVEAQAELLVDTQVADLKKAILFQYTSSAPTTDSEATLEDDLMNALDKYLESQSIEAGSMTVSSSVINTARFDFFEDPEVNDQIDAYQFVNGDPVSPICQDLAGTIFAKDDPAASRYFPPLHHNCKSYIMPILKGNLGSRETEDLKPSRSSLDAFVTLSEVRLGHIRL